MDSQHQDEILLTEDEWSDFKKKHNKIYSDDSDETSHRSQYLQNKKNIIEHNKKYETGQVTYKMAINQFADMSAEERSNCRGPPMKRTDL